MKYFRFWIKDSFTINIDGTEKINILAGSNVSKEDARLQALKSAQLIEDRISAGGRLKEYEVPIKEHVERVIDDQNIISVCRYGAKILNSTKFTILDLDDYPFDFFDLFKSVRKLPKKERIIFKFLQKIQQYPDFGSDFRIYETTKGIRVIGRKYVDPSGRRYIFLMRKFAVDWIYCLMSQKQNCYRARITPKPYRLRIKTIKIRSPLDCETQEYRDWSKNYEFASKKYRVVKLLKSVGNDFSNDPIIKLHDNICNAAKSFTLA